MYLGEFTYYVEMIRQCGECDRHGCRNAITDQTKTSQPGNMVRATIEAQAFATMATNLRVNRPHHVY